MIKQFFSVLLQSVVVVIGCGGFLVLGLLALVLVPVFVCMAKLVIILAIRPTEQNMIEIEEGQEKN